MNIKIIKISKTKWEYLEKRSKMTKESSCGILCDICKKCPEHIGLKHDPNGIKTNCCNGKVTDEDGNSLSDEYIAFNFEGIIK